jgi:hypothetical protein
MLGADNVSLVFAHPRCNSLSGLRPPGSRFSACRLFRTRNLETVTRRLQPRPNASSQIVRPCETVSRTTAPSCCFQKASTTLSAPRGHPSSLNLRRRFNRARFQHAFHGRRFGALVGMGVAFAAVKGEGGRSKPSTRCLCNAPCYANLIGCDNDVLILSGAYRL